MQETTFEATREAGLERLAAFTPAMGSDYERRRNFDLATHDNVSILSPWIRRRLVTEREAYEAAYGAHGERAEKFIQEVIWRTYWKGWLEQRPDVWEDYVAQVQADRNSVNRDRSLAADFREAIAGETGIEPFDHWARELVETGYLHNHARMWFASIWIFTLRLPWALGADFFYRHLLDGDPASNTLSWRWVAGLQTAGKTYLATRENIERFTEGRFQIPPGVLAETAEPIGDDDLEKPARVPLPLHAQPENEPSLLLVTEDDCLPESLDLKQVERAVLVATTPLRSPEGASEAVVTFERSALEDTKARLEEVGLSDVTIIEPGELAAELAKATARQIVGPHIPIGTARDALEAPLAELADQGFGYRPTVREWDAAFWPHATAGYFKLKKKTPAVLESLRFRT